MVVDCEETIRMKARTAMAVYDKNRDGKVRLRD